jgi:hypothetical protein
MRLAWFAPVDGGKDYALVSSYGFRIYAIQMGPPSSSNARRSQGARQLRCGGYVLWCALQIENLLRTNFGLTKAMTSPANLMVA